MGGRTWVILSVLSGAIAIALFGAIVLVSGGHPVTIVRAEALATPGQPVDTPFIYAAPDAAAPARPSAPSAASEPTENPGQTTTVSTSASENNAAPDISAPANPFTAGIH